MYGRFRSFLGGGALALANLPIGEDSTGLPVGTEPKDLDDEDDPYYSPGKKSILDLAFSI
jgi:hypothetical protein